MMNHVGQAVILKNNAMECTQGQDYWRTKINKIEISWGRSAAGSSNKNVYEQRKTMLFSKIS
jgi:hypothetical protein